MEKFKKMKLAGLVCLVIGIAQWLTSSELHDELHSFPAAKFFNFFTQAGIIFIITYLFIKYIKNR